MNCFKRTIYGLAAAILMSSSAAAQNYDLSVDDVISPPDLAALDAGFDVPLEAMITNNGPGDAPFVIVEFVVEDMNGMVVYGPENIMLGALPMGQSAVAAAGPWTPNQTGQHTVIVTSTLADLDPFNNQDFSTVFVNETIISTGDAIATITNDLINPSPIASTLVAFLHNYSEPTTWLPVGTQVTDNEGIIDRTLDAKTYFFWFDNEPIAEWNHSTSFILFNVWTGAYEVLDADSWPLIDGLEIPSLLDAHNTSADQIYGTYEAAHYDVVTYSPEDNPVTTTWALIVTGKPEEGDNSGEKVARANDVNRIKNYLNNNPRGPQIADENIKTLTGGAGMDGATEQEVCDMLESLQDCDKLYFFYGGHGDKGGSAYLQGGQMKWKTLACKLIENGAEEVCICIEACYAGTSESAMQDKSVPGDGGTSETLSGELVYSSSSGRTTYRRDSCGTYFYKGLEACSQNDSADVNGDSKISIKEAIMWAANRDTAVGNRHPGWTDLDNGARTTATSKSSYKRKKNTTGRHVHYTICRTCYVNETPVPKPGGGTKIEKSSTWYTRVYAEERNDRPVGTSVDVMCDDVKIGSFDGSLQRDVKKCIAGGPGKCRKFRLVESTNSAKPRGSDRTASVNNEDEVLYFNTTAYLPGQNLFYAIPIEEEPNHTLNATVVPITGWQLEVNPTTLTTSTLINPETVNLSGTVPTTATQGTLITAMVVDSYDNSTTLQIVNALVHTTINTNIVDGDELVFNQAHLFGSILSTNGTIEITNSNVHLYTSGSLDIDPGGTFIFGNSIIDPEYNVTWTADVEGTVDWMAIALVGPDDGLHLTGASGVIDGGAVHESGGDGLVLSGSLSGLTIDGFHITDSGDDGILADGVSNFTVEGADISGSAGDDVELSNNAYLYMLNSLYDSNKENVPAGSTLERTWSTTFNVKNQDDEALTNATVNVYDATMTLVSSTTANAEGFTDNVNLVEYVNSGGTSTYFTPHYVEVIYNNSTTLTQYTADEQAMHSLVIATPLITDAGDRIQQPVGPQLEVTPNPAVNDVNISLNNPELVDATLRVVDLRGQQVAVLFKGYLMEGRQSFRWDASGLPVGAYFVLLESSHYSSVARIVISR